MKLISLHNLVIVATSVLLATVLIVAEASHGQSPKGNANADQVDSHVKPTVLRSESGLSREAALNSKLLETAAIRNLTLQNELTWTFGGKQQHGWYLYTELIKHLLQTDKPAGSKEFAFATARWQQKYGLAPTGVLDQDSFSAMIGSWQSARIKIREVALPDSLFTAPISDFYDPERLEPLRQIERETYAAYKRLVAAAIAEPSLHLSHDRDGRLSSEEKFLKVISAFRSPEYQEQLRRQSPNAGTAGLALHSPHFTGRALDLYVGGDPVDTKDSNRSLQVQTPVYQWLVRNAERFGFRPYFYEPWHWEYVK